MLKHWRIAASCTFLLFAFAGALWLGKLSPSYRQCDANNKQGHAYNESANSQQERTRRFIVCQGAFFESNREAVTAVATVFIAVFTLTLWLATGRQARLTTKAIALTQETITLTRQDFLATHGPRLILREAFSLLTDWRESKIVVTYTITNVGASDCWITNCRLGVELVTGTKYPQFVITAENLFRDIVPYIGRIAAGESKTLDYIDPEQTWDANHRRADWSGEAAGVHFAGFVTYIDSPGSGIKAVDGLPTKIRSRRPALPPHLGGRERARICKLA
jgi:hypothetical protein